MIARARSTAGSRQGGADIRWLAALAAAPILSGILAPPAAAQVSGSIDIESDYRLRGYSLSAGRPTATAQIGYDDASGLYLGSRVSMSNPTRYRPDGRARYDWRVGISRQIGNLDLHAAASGGGPGKDYYAGSAHGGIALTAGASWSF